MKAGLIFPKFYSDDAVLAPAIDEQIRLVGATLNANLTNDNLATATKLPVDRFDENYAVTVLSSEPISKAMAAGPGSVLYLVGVVGFESRIVGVGWNFKIGKDADGKAVSAGSARTLRIMDNGVQILSLIVPASVKEVDGERRFVGDVFLQIRPTVQPNHVLTAAYDGVVENEVAGRVTLTLAAIHQG